MVSKQTGIIITAVTGVLFGCTSILTCLGGLLSAPFSTVPYEVSGWIWLFINACSALAFLSLPVVFYLLLVHNRPDDPPAGLDQ